MPDVVDKIRAGVERAENEYHDMRMSDIDYEINRTWEPMGYHIEIIEDVGNYVGTIEDSEIRRGTAEIQAEMISRRLMEAIHRDRVLEESDIIDNIDELPFDEWKELVADTDSEELQTIAPFLYHETDKPEKYHKVIADELFERAKA